MDKLYVGTAGWQYPEWKHTFYPQALPTSQFLTHYSSIFNAVELNSSFYQLPRPETITEWKARAQPHFKLCPRLTQTITCKKSLTKSGHLLKAFLELFFPLEQQLGPIVIEIPPEIPFSHENVEPFLDLLGKFSHHYTFVIEPRHISWVDPTAGEMCEQRELTWSISDFGGQIPTIQRAIGDKVYLRFHGTCDPDKSNYTIDTLEHCAEKVGHWLEEEKTVYVLFNNNFGGYALENAQQFQKLVLTR